MAISDYKITEPHLHVKYNMKRLTNCNLEQLEQLQYFIANKLDKPKKTIKLYYNMNNLTGFTSHESPQHGGE